jgi:CRISPR-associated protein Csh1
LINEISEIFNEKYKEFGEAMITDNYTLTYGDYGMFSLNDTEATIEFFKVDKNTDREQDVYKDFAKLDFISGLISMNKPMDPSKIIHSNNIYAFFVKKDNLDTEKGKLNNDIIDTYYNVLKNPSIKYKNKPKSQEIYLDIEKLHGKVDGDLTDKISSWVKENIFKIGKILNKDKIYLKLFYKTTVEDYKKESEKYILPNIYNSTDYNVRVNNKIYGLPDFNMGLNSKKPYLENKTRKSKLPVLVDKDKIVIEKNLFQYLMNYSAQGKNYVYFNNEIEGVPPKESKKGNFQGYFLRVTKGKEVEIEDSDIITGYNYELRKSIKVTAILKNGIGDAFSPFKGKLSDINKIRIAIDDIFFHKWLSNNFFTEAKKININDSTLKQSLIEYRYGFYTWFYKGEDSIVRTFWNKMTKVFLYNSMSKGDINGAINQFNLRYAFLDYFQDKEGGEKMAQIIKDIRKDVERKIKIKNDIEYEVEISNDREYYFCVGQLLQYFYAQNRSNSKNYSFVRPILAANSDKFIKDQLKRLFIKYSYAISGALKFNNMYYMVAAYEPKANLNQDAIVAGFVSPNLILKKEEQNDKKEKQNDIQKVEEN